MTKKHEKKGKECTVKPDLRAQLDRSDFTFTILFTPGEKGDSTITVWFPDDKGPETVLERADSAIHALEQLRDGLDELIDNMKDPR